MMMSRDLELELDAISQEVACEMPHDTDATGIAQAVVEMVPVGPLYDEIKALFKTHGYEAVVAEAAKHVSTW